MDLLRDASVRTSSIRKKDDIFMSIKLVLALSMQGCYKQRHTNLYVDESMSVHIQYIYLQMFLSMERKLFFFNLRLQFFLSNKPCCS